MADKGTNSVNEENVKSDKNEEVGETNKTSTISSPCVDKRVSEEDIAQRYQKAYDVFLKLRSQNGPYYKSLLTVTDIIIAMCGSEGPPIEDLLIPKTLQWDLIIGLPHMQISFLLNHLIPRRHISKALSRWTAKKLENRAAELFQGSAPKFKTELAGSIPEGFSVPPHFPRKSFKVGGISAGGEAINASMSDADVIIVAMAKRISCKDLCDEAVTDKGVNFIMETDHTYPGYCRLVMVNPAEATSDYKALKPGSCDKYYFKSEQMMLDVIGGMDLTDVETNVGRHGPAVTAEPDTLIHFKAEEPVLLDNDFVMAMQCSEWPTEATKWLDRKSTSGWPSQELKEQLVSEGCLVVATPHQSSTWREVEWRISMSRAERALANSLGDIQRQCYILLKVLVKHVLSPIKSITSYHLKTLLFWTCEKLPQEILSTPEEGLSQCFLLLLDELLHAILNHNLPHYFFIQNNLFSGIHPDFMADIGKRISWLRRNLPQAVFNFDNQYVFTFSPRLVTMENIFGDLILESQKYHSDISKDYTGQLQVLQCLAKAFLFNANIDDMIDTARDICQIQENVFGVTMDFVALSVVTAMSGPKEFLHMTYEYLIKRFPSNDNLAWLQGNLAGMCHNLAYEKENDKEYLIQRADDLYQGAVKHQKCTAATWADYATFFLKEGKFDKAIEAAQSAKNKSESGSKNGFTKDVLHTLPECLQRDIELDGDLNVNTAVYASYLLVLCMVKQNQTEYPLICLDELNEKLLALDPGDFASWKLLAYGWLAVGDTDKPKKAFEKVLEMNADSAAAKLGLQELTQCPG